MRFGLVGTGPWAHDDPRARALGGRWTWSSWASGAAIRRRPVTLATTLGVAAYDDYDALLADVDAVAFSVPPDIQAEMALVAARAGKHLLLDKPVALSAEAARELRDAAAASGVASVVFFTDRFVETSREWFEHVRTTSGWGGGWLRWFSALQEPDNPYGASAWRHEQGALWDTGPHALSTLSGRPRPDRVADRRRRGRRPGDARAAARVRRDEHGGAHPVRTSPRPRASRRRCGARRASCRCPPARGHGTVGAAGHGGGGARPRGRVRRAARARPGVRDPKRRTARRRAGAAGYDSQSVTVSASQWSSPRLPSAVSVPGPPIRVSLPSSETRTSSPSSP